MPADKAALRRLLRARWSAWAERDTVSRAITAILTAHPLWRDARTVFLYLGGLDEVATSGLLASAYQSGKTVALPRCLGDGVMELRRFEGTLIADAHGIPAPPATARLVEVADLTLVPGLAFDRRGFRLGRGGGYYDRYLTGYDGVSLGLCPEAFCLDAEGSSDAFGVALPTDAWDRPVKGLVTERGLVLF